MPTQNSIVDPEHLAAQAELLRKRLGPVLSAANAVGTIFDWCSSLFYELLSNGEVPPGTSTCTPIRGREMICFQVGETGTLKLFRLFGTTSDLGIGIAIPRIAFPRNENLEGAPILLSGGHPVVAAYTAQFGPTSSALIAPIYSGDRLWGALSFATPAPDPLGNAPETILQVASTEFSARLATFSIVPRIASPVHCIYSEADGMPFEMFASKVEGLRKLSKGRSADLHLAAYALPRVPLTQRKQSARVASVILPLVRSISRDSDFICAYSTDVVLICLTGCPQQNLPAVIQRLREKIRQRDPAAGGDVIVTSRGEYGWVPARDLISKIVADARAGIRT